MRWMSFFQRNRLRLLVSVLLLIVFLPGISGAGNAHANTVKASFDIEPTFFPHPNARPRPYFTYNSAPAATIWDNINVKNVGKIRGVIKLYAVDATTSQGGGVAFVDPTQPQHDVGAWIKLSSHEVTLNAGQSQDIPFSLSIPKKVRPGQHGGGILAEGPVEQISSVNYGPYNHVLQQQLQKDLGVLVSLPGATTEQLRTTGITYDERSPYQRLLIGLANTGTQLLHPQGSLQVMNTAGKLMQNVPLTLDTFVPQTAIQYPIYFQHQTLNPGIYTAKLSLGYEYHNSLTYTTRFIVPLPQLHDNAHTSQIVSNLVTNDPDIFKILTPLDDIVGLLILFLSLSSILFWSKKMHRFVMNARRKRKDI